MLDQNQVLSIDMTSRFRNRILFPVILAALCSCASFVREKAAGEASLEREGAENCALAKERQNPLAIEHWCRERR